MCINFQSGTRPSSASGRGNPEVQRAETHENRGFCTPALPIPQRGAHAAPCIAQDTRLHGRGCTLALPAPHDAEATMHPCIAHTSGRGSSRCTPHCPRREKQSPCCTPVMATPRSAELALRPCMVHASTRRVAVAPRRAAACADCGLDGATCAGHLSGECVDRICHETPIPLWFPK
jgi:hypothetical protein